MDCNGWIDPWGISSAALRRNLGASYGDNKQAQHLIPEEVWNDTDNTKFFNDIGLGDGRDKKENGLMMWDYWCCVDFLFFIVTYWYIIFYEDIFFLTFELS